MEGLVGDELGDEDDDDGEDCGDFGIECGGDCEEVEYVGVGGFEYGVDCVLGVEEDEDVDCV